MEIKRNKPSFNDISKNKAVTGSIIAAVCIVIYVFALIQGTVRIYLSIDQRKTTAQREFSWIADRAFTVGRQGFMNERFIQNINDALASTQTIEALIVTGADNGHAFEKKTDHAIAWVNNSPRFKNKFNFSSQDLYRALDIPNIRNANIKGMASAFDYADLNKILKETLLIILVGFALAFFTMLIHILSAKPKGRMIQGKTPQRKRETEEQSEEAAVTEQGPKGLYSPRSGIGWEEYTKDRLDSELHRCSSAEKDLALLLMDFPKITDDIYKKAAKEAVSFFTSRDLLFEYGKYGICVIIPGMGLDTAITKSENFYQRVLEKTADDDQEFFNIGISSRSGRLLNSDRLLLEAGEALKKARISKTSIIAFKSDPEKYREFIRNHD